MSKVGRSLRATIDLYFDGVSPYCWFAFEGLQRYVPSVWRGVQLNARPLPQSTLTPAEQQDGDGSPLQPELGVPHVAYMMRDLSRRGAYWALPVRPVQNPRDLMSPMDSYVVNKFLLSVQQHSPPGVATAAVGTAAHALWVRRWESHVPALTPADYMHVCTHELGLPEATADSILGRMPHESIADVQHANINEALATGAFAVPWTVLTLTQLDADDDAPRQHCFFGADFFPIVADILGDKFVGPLRPERAA